METKNYDSVSKKKRSQHWWDCLHDLGIRIMTSHKFKNDDPFPKKQKKVMALVGLYTRLGRSYQIAHDFTNAGAAYSR